MKNKKLIKYLGAALVILIIIVVIAKNRGCVGKDVMVKVSTEKAEKRTITEMVTANGKIQPEIEVKLAPDVSGEVVELEVNEGDEVEKGQLLVKINPDIYESALDRMEASLNTSKANLANAKARLAQVKAQFINAEANYKRNKKLWEDGVVSDADFENTKSNYEVAKADVEAAEQNVIAAKFNVKSAAASLKEARENLSKTNIYAPMNGTISKLNIEKGERVVGTSQFEGTEIMRVANLSEMEVNVSVNENDIVRVEKGDTALIEVDAYINRKFKGVVTQIANSANTTGISADQVTNFDVTIKILRESYKDLIDKENGMNSPFRPGMSASVDIQTETAYDVVTVPIQAVTTREDTTSTDSATATLNKKDENIYECLFVVSGNMVSLKRIETGIQDNKYIHVTKNLEEGEEVVVAPYRAISKKLKEGTKVEVVKKETLFK